MQRWMTRLALTGKCGGLTTPRQRSLAGGRRTGEQLRVEQPGQREASEPVGRAAEEGPAVDAPRNALGLAGGVMIGVMGRFIRRTGYWIGCDLPRNPSPEWGGFSKLSSALSGGRGAGASTNRCRHSSIARDGLVEVEDDAADVRPRRDLGGFVVGRHRGEADVEQLLRSLGMSSRVEAPLRGEEGEERGLLLRPGWPRERLPEEEVEPLLVGPGGGRDKLPARTRAASTNVGSLSSVSACCGVLATVRAAVHSSRDGASKLASIGCRNVRCQCV